MKKDILKNFPEFTGKHLCQSPCNFIKKETLAHVFSREFCEIFKNTFLTEPRATASAAVTKTNSIQLLK